ncbi:MAG: metalloprotease PmbA [Buchnera aphidicola (Periphyllus lyropictus)]|uniref:metalloprotease PmbA n=1 Tax=Buchnera aphidicola TaxID=9 RepID=UPI001EBACC5C|nr:metalloprotease PmbA [Buchnera aphidicola]NIH16742.1 metalloprotease PmbA [Buchnera aphidicola (Periphyllus lyropictus)]USS94642.1 metalloprotease PmbA [Buchnera aphidicola (Periphyllus lyropictus)]
MYEIKEILKQELFLKKVLLKSLSMVNKLVDESFIFIRKNYNKSMTVRNGKIEYIEFNNDIFFSIVVYSNFKKGSASSTDLNINSIKKTIFSAIEISKYTSSDKYSGLPDFDLANYKTVDLDLFHPSYINFKESFELAYSCEKYALDFSEKIVNTEGSCFSSQNSIIAFGNTKGILETYKSSQYFLSTCVIAQDKNSNKKERDEYYSISRKLDCLSSPKYIGRKCSRKTLMKLNPVKIISKIYSIILTSDVSFSIFRSLSKAISGYEVYKNSTFLRNSLNKLIFPNWLSIYEDPHIKRGIGSLPFDNEGTLTLPRFIVKDGVLKTWLLDSYSSRKLNLKNTGHSGGIYNWKLIQKYNISFHSLLKKMNTGLVITDFMGDGINIVNGDYSRGASGYFIKNGIFKYAVSEITLSGNLFEIYKNISAISNDYDIRQNIQCGSILISNMIVSGV